MELPADNLAKFYLINYMWNIFKAIRVMYDIIIYIIIFQEQEKAGRSILCSACDSLLTHSLEGLREFSCLVERMTLCASRGQARDCCKNVL